MNLGDFMALGMDEQRRILDAASRQSRSKALLASDFNDWWAKNHPLDWWAKDRGGSPLPESDRIRVWAICKRAYEANNRISASALLP